MAWLNGGRQRLRANIYVCTTNSGPKKKVILLTGLTYCIFYKNTAISLISFLVANADFVKLENEQAIKDWTESEREIE